MCDEDTARDASRQLTGGLNRRRFNTLAAAGTLALTLPRAASALSVLEGDVTIDTPAGKADAYLAHPASGRHPAVLVWPDIFGLRPAFQLMGRRLAESGYTVLVVNPYYRSRPAPVAPTGASFDDPGIRELLMPLYSSLTPAVQSADGSAFVGWLEQHPVVDPDRPMAAIGYCMGGPMVLRTAAARPDRIAAGASFHGARLVTEDTDSPHRLIDQLAGRYLIAIAENDHAREPATRDTLSKSFAAAGLSAEIEVYGGALHGWCPPDSKVYNEAQAERAWARLLALLGDSLV